MYPITTLPPVRLDALYRYKRLWANVIDARAKFHDQKTVMLNVIDKYAEDHPELLESIKALRLEIRNVTRGAPLQEAFDSVTSDMRLDSVTEQLFNVNTAIAKKLYKQAANLTHPDKGGDPELFNQVVNAYKNRDSLFLGELIRRLSRKDGWLYQQGEGMEYAARELERVRVSLEMTKLQPLYHIYYAHLVNNKASASRATGLYLHAKRVELTNELKSLLKGASNGQERNQESQSEVEEQTGSESNQES